MSQRLGMADGRCFTINTNSQLVNDFIMNNNGISLADNYSYRKLLQQMGPEIVERIQSMQGVSPCQSCDIALLKIPDTN